MGSGFAAAQRPGMTAGSKSRPHAEFAFARFPQLLSEAAQCEGCFALLELETSKGDLVPQAVLVLNLGARRANFEAHFKPIQARLKQIVVIGK